MKAVKVLLHPHFALSLDKDVIARVEFREDEKKVEELLRTAGFIQTDVKDRQLIEMLKGYTDNVEVVEATTIKLEDGEEFIAIVFSFIQDKNTLKKVYAFLLGRVNYIRHVKK